MTLRPGLAFDPPPFNDPEQERKWLRKSVERLDRFLGDPAYEEFWRTHDRRQVRADWISLLSLTPRLAWAMICFEAERTERIEQSRPRRSRSRASPATPPDDLTRLYPWIEHDEAE